MKTILRCTKRNITKEVIFYKMTRVLSSQHLSWSESHIYCSTTHHSNLFKSFKDVVRSPESREQTGPERDN